MYNELRATLKGDLGCPRISGQPFFLSNVGDSDCSFVVMLMNFEPACCRIDHSDTFAYQVLLSFSAYGIWTNEIYAHLIPRYCFCNLFWEVSKVLGSSAFVYLTSRADCHRVCDLISHFWAPKVLTNGFLGPVACRATKAIVIPIDNANLWGWYSLQFRPWKSYFSLSFPSWSSVVPKDLDGFRMILDDRALTSYFWEFSSTEWP